ncbi:HEPN domain-containing protein [Candidatus Bathyarchaeota archaeon]|jgi:uncharacterized protein (UPF0332 family)|nr:HEPN domain-containing protein [Candidatus Bathyarchaeota archaeon]
MKLDECFRRGLLKRIQPDHENALRSLDLSTANIEDAAENLRIRRYRVVIVSSYTAMFHAARAILFRDGVKERSHECIPIYLNERYPELERIANTLDSYRRFRHNVIYGLDMTLNETEARAALDSARELLEEVRKIMDINK